MENNEAYILFHMLIFCHLEIIEQKESKSPQLAQCYDYCDKYS